ncbi:unnamed protein product [Mytilus coruscus]|uniref:Uncharacterized protein n=1 Tax=Mytilus coruscus TaxID=42192 RepID=A0A6J8AS53_MYTCO|nr:unnamed protein product [Mytilus coruscus]
MTSDSRTIFGATSSRPEPQCPAAATVQQFDDRAETNYALVHIHVPYCIRYVKSYMEENFDNISMGKFIWCQVSTPEDITQYHQRYAKNWKKKRKRSHKAINTPRSSHFTWHEKCMIISAIPNNHYWDEADQAHVGYVRMLSVRDVVGKQKPASLRNLTLLHCRDKDFGTIYQLVKRYKNPATETSAIQSTVNQTSNYTDVSQPEEQRSARTRRKALTEEDILRNLTILNPDFIEENRSTENSLYQQYKTAQIETGTLQWGLHKPHIDILYMNDINMNTGTIYDFSYVHMTRTLEGNELHYNCTCKLYATLLQLATLNDNLDAEIYDVNIRCRHIRLFKEVIEPIFVNVFTPESIPQPTKSQEIVIKSLELLDIPVCILPSTLTTKKFTVRDENDTESCNFVHLSKTV